VPALGVLAATFIGIVPGPGAAPPPPCRRASERIVAVSGLVAVLRRGARLVACERRSGRRRLLHSPGRPLPNQTSGAYRVTASYSAIAYAAYSVCTVCGSTRDDVVRVRFGLDGSKRSIVAPHSSLPEAYGASVRDLAVNGCGTTAVLVGARTNLGPVASERELHLWPGRSETVLLDRGGIEAGSLRVTDTHVLWRRDGRRLRRRLATTCAHPA
jgi:hypothetical protein